MSEFKVCCQSCVGSSVSAKQSIVRAFPGTWTCIFDKAGMSEMLSV